MLAAGFPDTSAASSVNRFCSSGLKAVQDIANQISSGSIDIGLAMGGESMTNNRGADTPFSPEIMANQEAVDCTQPMIQTSENVGNDFNISRRQQDEYAVESFRRAEVAQKAGWFEDEIVPITTKIKDPNTGELKEITLTKDEGPRYGTTLEGLSKIRPAMPQFGDKTTGGNASQVTDGGKIVHSIRGMNRTGRPSMLLFCFPKPQPLVYWFTNLCLFVTSRRRSSNETIQSNRTRPTHPRQILRRHRRRRAPSHHGHRSLSRHPEIARQVPIDKGRH